MGNKKSLNALIKEFSHTIESIDSSNNDRNHELINGIEYIVKKTIDEFNLIDNNDRIQVLMSGGKDSTTVAYILKKLNYNMYALHVNFGYGLWSKVNEENVKKFCEQHSIKLKIINFEEYSGKSMKEIRDILKLKENRRWCFTCGILRRKLFNIMARKEEATKVATGHNMNDEIQNFLMNLLTGNKISLTRFSPLIKTTNDEKLVPRIKPLFFVPENLIKSYSIIKNFPVMYSPCPCSYTAFRGIVEKFINQNLNDPKVMYNLVRKAFMFKEIAKTRFKTHNIRYCNICGEPSSNSICMPCQLMTKYEKILNLVALQT
ncbi:MAG: TIGR00269 family protein [Candidatus Micrarchaeota archaeon]|nr:TIGR00269 family protein [Candidatus Micrarchaeota archaeon]